MADAENYEVIVLVDGYSHPAPNGGMEANCTCTLIKGPKNIIVDTMTAWDGPIIEGELKKNSLTCDDIDYVVCTHGHSDHIGCNYLFRKATHIVGHSVSHHDHYTDFSTDFLIDTKVKVISTPGHTLQDVSVLVTTQEKGVVAICGDLFEKEEDLLDDGVWKKAGSDNEELQKCNRELILKTADWIVPGHGPMFKNPRQPIG